MVAALVFSSRMAAQEAADSTHVLNEVIVTSNKYPKKQSSTGKVVTVIDKAILRQLQGRTLGEILNMASGTTINGANNVLGTNQRISIRGAADGNVLLLMDGIPVNDPSVISNYFDLNFISPETVERIEILKGGQSTLYGSDAVAGVINIISRKPSAQAVSPSASLAYGSYGTWRTQAGLSGTKGILSYRLSGERVSSNGFSAAFDSTSTAGFDRDGFLQNSVNAETGIALSPKTTLKLQGSYSFYKTDLDAGAFRDDKDFRANNKNGRAGLTFNWEQPKGKLRFQYSLNYIDRYYLDDSTDKGSFGYFSESSYAGTTHFAELYKNLRLKNWELLAGTDYRYNLTAQNYFSVSSYGPYRQPDLNKDASQVSAYASAVYNKNDWNIEAGGRWNRHSAYGHNFTFTFNPAYLLAETWKFYANISSAYKAPSLFQLYDGFAGNINLLPEKSYIYEAGLTWFGKSMKWRLTAFQQHTNTAIQYIITDPQTYQGKYANVKAQNNHGIETEFNYQQGRWRLQGNYTFTDGNGRSTYTESGDPLPKDTVYNNLYRVPAHAANLFAGFQLNEKFSVSSLLKLTGQRLEPVYAAAPITLNGYSTLDLSLHYRPAEKATVFLNLNNVTDTEYFDVKGYNSRGINFTAGIQLHL